MTSESSFSNPHEELAYLRSKVLETEKRLEKFGEDFNRPTVVKDSLKDFVEGHSSNLTATEKAEVVRTTHIIENTEERKQLDHMMKVTESKGILHALSAVEKLKEWKLEDDFHDFLVDLITRGLPLKGVGEKGPEFKALHMCLYEVLLPKSGESDKSFSELVKGMEQLYAGFLSIASSNKSETDYMVFEIANPEGSEDTNIFVSVPNESKALFESQTLAIFPNARLIPRANDYNVFNIDGVALGSSARLKESGAYPLQTAENFGEDPMNVILNSFSKIPKSSAGAALQIVFKPKASVYTDKFKKALENIKKGMKPKEALKNLTISGEIFTAFSEILFSKDKKKDEEKKIDEVAVKMIEEKLESPIVETNIRLVVSAKNEPEAREVLGHLESAFNQFENSGKNSLRWERAKANQESDFYRAFTFRLFREYEAVVLNLRELSTMLHFHTESLIQSSPLKQLSSKGAPAPSRIPNSGTLIGVNKFQGSDRNIFITAEDRLRHFYTIGQTGTGKSTLLKSMIIQDILSGSGVCMIDPHGSDVLEVLANIPEERLRDVIYFDPSNTLRPMSLNMLEYDRSKPEQKTFVVNELFSIFQKLYGGVPESMGPMFEQYFRNATLLVIEDPETGSTLLDVSRVMANKEFRQLKLSRCQNPVVVQFWKDIAEKAGGDGALANMVPYITSKFDVFLANDIMRPIISQEKSSFNFRDIMDNKKILLVNLSKGKLGDINANLIGLILVGKFLMAALSRVDSMGMDFPAFYLHIDEFQNITTPSIATILSEARKYKLSLSMAHQFIAQLDEGTKNAVFGNVGNICAFRVGADDAEYLEKQFSPIFKAKDLMNIDNFKAHVKLLMNNRPADAFDIELISYEKKSFANLSSIIELSGLKYGRSREEIEAEISSKFKKPEPII